MGANEKKGFESVQSLTGQFRPVMGSPEGRGCLRPSCFEKMGHSYIFR